MIKNFQYLAGWEQILVDILEFSISNCGKNCFLRNQLIVVSERHKRDSRQI